MKASADQLPEFNARIAEAMVAASDKVPGLPRYLGVVIEELEAGRLVATMPVREDL